MKITILGTGAIGSLFAAGLAQNHDLTCVVGTKKHADSINRSGIRIMEKDGSIRSVSARAVTDTSGAEPSDLVLIAVKAPVTASAVSLHRNLFGPRTLAVSLQNGYGNHIDIETVVPPQNIIIGTTSQGANTASDGTVRHAGSGSTVIGALIPEAEGTASAASSLFGIKTIFEEAGFPTVITEDAEDAVIRKLFINVGINAVCALSDVQNIHIVSDPDKNHLSHRLVEEAVKIFNCTGRSYDAEKIWDQVQSVARATGENYCSMVQDIRNRRPTEIGRINGAVVKTAENIHEDAPLNRRITEQIEALTEKF